MRVHPIRLTSGMHLAAGLALVGLSGYAFLAVAGQMFVGPDGARHVASLTALYLLVNIIGPGVFTALEQETSRSVSRAVTAGEPLRATARRAGMLAASASAVIAAVVVVAWPLALSRVFDDETSLLGALLVAIVGSAAAYWARGVLGGQQHFQAYAVTFYVEGGFRLVALIVLFLTGFADPIAFGFSFAVAPLLAAVVAGAALRLPRGPSAAPRGMARSFGFLVIATAVSQSIANLAPVVVTYRIPDHPIDTSVFGSSFVLARLPLFVFTPVLAVLLPRLTRHVANRLRTEFEQDLKRVIALLLGVGGLGVIGAAVAGPAAVELLFRSAARPDTLVLALLTSATVLVMLALVLQLALVALGAQSAVSRGWAVGLLIFVAILCSPLPPITAAVTAQLVGPLVVVVLLGLQIRRVLPTLGAAEPHVSSDRA